MIVRRVHYINESTEEAYQVVRLMSLRPRTANDFGGDRVLTAHRDIIFQTTRAVERLSLQKRDFFFAYVRYRENFILRKWLEENRSPDSGGGRGAECCPLLDFFTMN